MRRRSPALRRSGGRGILLRFFELPFDFANVLGIQRASHFAERTARFVDLQRAPREIDADDAHALQGRGERTFCRTPRAAT